MLCRCVGREKKGAKDRISHLRLDGRASHPRPKPTREHRIHLFHPFPDIQVDIPSRLYYSSKDGPPHLRADPKQLPLRFDPRLGIPYKQRGLAFHEHVTTGAPIPTLARTRIVRIPRARLCECCGCCSFSVTATGVGQCMQNRHVLTGWRNSGR